MTPAFSLIQWLLLFTVAAPFCAFVLLGTVWLAGWKPSERFVAQLTRTVYATSFAAVVALGIGMYTSGTSKEEVLVGTWFRIGDYRYGLSLLADRLSVPMLALTVLLVGVIGSFSVRYLHRDPGYFRFFLLLHLFGFGSVLAFAAGSLDLLVAGWEMVGITSVLLIAFFHTRQEPVANAFRTFATYRLCDVGLLIGVFALHQAVGSAACSALFRGDWPGQATTLTPGAATLVGFLLLLAASGKSAQLPFSGWLPRAMEGPTPSSAIFYGAISVHLGCYLLLRVDPILEAAPAVRAVTVLIGLMTALHATMSGRASTDAKTSLAYASMAQIGLIFAECAMGWSWLALMHMAGHAAIRTLQFLRAPSMLHDYHRVHAAAGGHLPESGAHYETLLPSSARSWLYRLALDRGHLDTILDRFITGPLVRIARVLASVEARSGSSDVRRISVAQRPQAARGIDA